MTMSRALMALVFATCAMSCSTVVPPATWPNRSPCLDDASAAPLLHELEKVTDSTNGAGPSTTELAKSVCEKRIYVRGKYRVVIFREPSSTTVGWGAGNGMIGGFAGPNRPQVTDAAAAQCLAQAGDDLHRFGIEPELLDTYHKENPELWSDADGGPARYLNCSGGRDSAYYTSLMTMVHEVTHQLTSERGTCLFLGYPPGKMCFSIPSTLPSASIAILKEFPTENRKQLEVLGKAQDLYLVDFSKVNKGPLFLFNELNAYTAGNETLTAIARREGVDKLYRDGERMSEMLPLLTLWVARYLAEMKQRDPDFYSETLTADTDDGRNIRALLTRAEDSYAAWIAELKKAGKGEKDPEHNLGQEYLKEKKLISN
jgi:hypothetical protein